MLLPSCAPALREPPFLHASHRRSQMNVLVLNVGSSTVKFQLVRTDLDRMASNGDETVARGTIERLGGESLLSLRGANGTPVRTTAPLRDHRAAVEYILSWLVSDESGPA